MKHYAQILCLRKVWYTVSTLRRGEGPYTEGDREGEAGHRGLHHEDGMQPGKEVLGKERSCDQLHSDGLPKHKGRNPANLRILTDRSMAQHQSN